MTAIKRSLPFVLVLFAATLLYLLFWPVPISPASWTPPAPPPLTGAYQQNSRLANVQRLSLGPGFAPEDVAFDSKGRIYAGLDDGRIIRLQPDGTQPEVFAETHGRPLGLKFDPTGNLIVADANKGLLAIDRDGSITTLTTDAEGVAFRCTNDLDIGANGTIYFTDASQRFGIDEFQLDFIEGQATGRLFSFDPRTSSLQMRIDGLAFANGVALGPDEEYVLVNETAAHRITRLWLKGAKAGTREPFVENLPGYPDNISFNGRDLFWVALAGPRVKAIEDTYNSPFTRRVRFRLMSIGLMPPPTPEPYGCVVAVNLQGQIVATLQDPGGRTIPSITSVIERDGLLYFGSLQTDRIATLPVPPALLGQPR